MNLRDEPGLVPVVQRPITPMTNIVVLVPFYLAPECELGIVLAAEDAQAIGERELHGNPSGGLVFITTFQFAATLNSAYVSEPCIEREECQELRSSTLSTVSLGR